MEQLQLYLSLPHCDAIQSCEFHDTRKFGAPKNLRRPLLAFSAGPAARRFYSAAAAHPVYGWRRRLDSAADGSTP